MNSNTAVALIMCVAILSLTYCATGGNSIHKKNAYYECLKTERTTCEDIWK